MTINISGRLGQIATLVLFVVYGVCLALSIPLPAPLVGVWLAVGALLWLAGV